MWSCNVISNWDKYLYRAIPLHRAADDAVVQQVELPHLDRCASFWWLQNTTTTVQYKYRKEKVNEQIKRVFMALHELKLRLLRLPPCHPVWRGGTVSLQESWSWAFSEVSWTGRVPRTHVYARWACGWRSPGLWGRSGGTTCHGDDEGCTSVDPGVKDISRSYQKSTCLYPLKFFSNALFKCYTYI